MCHFRQARISKPKARSPHRILTRDLRRSLHVADQQIGCTKQVMENTGCMADSQTTRVWDSQLRYLQSSGNLQVNLISILPYYKLQTNKYCSWSLKSTSSHLNAPFLPSQRTLNVSARSRVIFYKVAPLHTHTQNTIRVLNTWSAGCLPRPRNTKKHMDSSRERSKLRLSSLCFSFHLEGEMRTMGCKSILSGGVEGSQPWDLLLIGYIHIKCIAFVAFDP